LGVSVGALVHSATPGGRLATIGVATGVITATVTNIDATIANSSLVMTPSSNAADGSITWSWSSGDMPAAYIPRR
jgi:hypothetical protein